MSHRTLLVIICALALVAACAVNTPITVWDFNSNCVFSVNRGGFHGEDDGCGGDVMRICKDYEDMLGDRFVSRAQCMNNCSALHAQQYQAHVMDGCQRNVEHAYSLCGQFCMRNYAQ